MRVSLSGRGVLSMNHSHGPQKASMVYGQNFYKWKFNKCWRGFDISRSCWGKPVTTANVRKPFLRGQDLHWAKPGEDLHWAKPGEYFQVWEGLQLQVRPHAAPADSQWEGPCECKECGKVWDSSAFVQNNFPHPRESLFKYKVCG